MPAESFNSNTRKISMADFNYNAVQKNNPLSRMMHEFGCKSMLPTNEMTTNNNTQIDAIFSNFEPLICGVYESYFSDHKPIFCWIDGIANEMLDTHDMKVSDPIPQGGRYSTNFISDYVSDTYSEGEPGEIDAIEEILDDSQIPLAQNNVANRKLGFFNTGLSCWANAMMQCFLNLKGLRELIEILGDDGEIQHFKAVFDEYFDERATSDSITDTLMEFRKHFDPAWSRREPRDLTEAMYAIFHRYEIFGNVFGFEQAMHEKCPSGCTNNRHIDRGCMYTLYLPESNECNNVQDLLNENQSEEVVIENFLCARCGAQVTQTRLLENPNNVVILYLQVAKRNPTPDPQDPSSRMIKEMNFKVLENVADQNILINDETFEFSGSILYHGGPVLNSATNHYTAILRHNNVLVNADDSTIISPYNWPKNSKDLFVMFYLKKETQP